MSDIDDFSIDIPPLDGPSSQPLFSDLFSDESSSTTATTDLSLKKFTKYEKLLESPKNYFNNPDYYKVALNGEGDIAKRVHQILQEFLKATDSQDKSMHRGRMIPAYWELYTNIASRVGTKLSDPKFLLVRFSILLHTAIEADQRQMIASIPFRNDSGEPIYYIDEWLKEVSFGRVSTSAVDETKNNKGNEAAKFNAVLEKTRGRYEAQLQLMRNVSSEMATYEKMLLEHAQNIYQHSLSSDSEGIPQAYSEGQRASFSEIGEMVRRLSLNNRKLQMAQTEFTTISEQFESLRAKEGSMEQAGEGDVKAIVEEMNTVKQMAKMCVGRQGNHFPMLMKSYFRGGIRDMGTRENLINFLADIEFLDGGLFLRTFKQQTNRIVPNIILIPCYGDYGICWEPFERHNRATSRGRIAIPMYPKDLRTAIISAMADLRWQVAKEKAQHYWMEEGLTGWYYQWFAEKKMKGDVKDQFILDYILWITKESEGTQKLEREVRDIFWRYMPFPQEIKDKLKNRGFVYAELCKKDFNRSISDGY